MRITDENGLPETRYFPVIAIDDSCHQKVALFPAMSADQFKSSGKPYLEEVMPHIYHLHGHTKSPVRAVANRWNTTTHPIMRPCIFAATVCKEDKIMNNHINNKYVATGISSYNDSFWKAMRGSDKAYGDLIDGKHSLTNTYLLPESTATKYSATLKENDLFRRIGTVMNATKSDSKIWLSDNDDFPAWVSEHGTIPTTAESFPKKDVAAHKLAIITSIETDFISDLGFDLERYLVVQFAKRFGKAEEAAFINGTDVNMPRGILHDTEGAEIGVEAAGDISFDDVLALYFSVFKPYRANGAWLMNDETALKLKTLKDQNGQYLWNQNSDTILGKPVHISEYMPSDGKPIAFGDFSYYTIVDRMPLTVRTLFEKFALEQKIGYVGVEHLDGFLLRPEAVKVMKVTS